MYIVDYILQNGKIITVTEGTKEALAICGKRIAAVGKNEKIRKLAGNMTKIIDLKGKTLLPGFIDAHTHFISMGLEKTLYLDLTRSNSLNQVLEMVGETVKNKAKGEWIIGRGWDESKWKENRYITREDLDKVAPHNPVVLIRVDGHLFSVNSQALKAVELPASREVDQSKGLVREKAAWELYRQIEPKPSAIIESIRKAFKIAHRLGVTSIHDTVKPPYIRAYQELNRRKELKIRVYLNVVVDCLDDLIQTGLSTGFGDEFLKLGGIKILADGSIGARNAALLKPYLDQGGRGRLNYQKRKLADFVKKARANGFQTAIHAIGDQAIQVVLDAFIKAKAREDERHRIEHLELVTEEQIEKISKLGITVSMQPNFLKWGREGGLYEKRLGPERSKRINPFKKLSDKRIKLAFGSDSMPFSPLYGIHQAVNAPYGSQRLSVNEALTCYTLNSAYASFEEDIKGSIEEGKLADLVVLSQDPFENSKNIKKIKVEQTFIGGEQVYPP